MRFSALSLADDRIVVAFASVISGVRLTVPFMGTMSIVPSSADQERKCSGDEERMVVLLRLR